MTDEKAMKAAEDAVIEAMIEHGPDGHIDGYEEIARAAVNAYLAALSTQPAVGGALLIAAERERQIREEGYDAAHDEGHADDLMAAAYCYVRYARWGEPLDWAAWPWADRYWKPTGDPVRDLTKAGALIAAAIDSIRAERNGVQS